MRNGVPHVSTLEGGYALWRAQGGQVDDAVHRQFVRGCRDRIDDLSARQIDDHDLLGSHAIVWDRGGRDRDVVVARATAHVARGADHESLLPHLARVQPDVVSNIRVSVGHRAKSTLDP